MIPNPFARSNPFFIDEASMLRKTR